MIEYHVSAKREGRENAVYRICIHYPDGPKVLYVDRGRMSDRSITIAAAIVRFDPSLAKESLVPV